MSVEVYTPDVNKIIHETKVDFYRGIISKTVQLVQYDSVIPVIAVSLYLNDAVYTVSEMTTVSMKVRWLSPNKTVVHKDILGCNSARNIAYVGVDSDMTDGHGTCNPIIELVVLENDISKTVGTSSFKVVIDRNPIEESEE